VGISVENLGQGSRIDSDLGIPNPLPKINAIQQGIDLT
jgi:hypothetical protein